MADLRTIEITTGLDNCPGWRHARAAATCAYAAGFMLLNGICLEGEALARHLAERCPADEDRLIHLLRRLDGHFAFVVRTPTFVIAAADRIRSIPLVYAHNGRRLSIDQRAAWVRQQCAALTFDTHAALEVAMAGYALGDATLYREIRQLEAGGYLIFDARGPRAGRYHRYEAWRVDRGRSRAALKRELVDGFEYVFEKLVRSLGGRPVMIPLSGGLDSRLIAAGLHRKGYRDVICFAYGRAGNFEARRSREVAERLGYRWHFVPYTSRGIRAFAASTTNRAHLAFADTAASVPFLQDLAAIDALVGRGLVPRSAVFINGQSGDFITGNHVPAQFTEPTSGMEWPSRRDRVVRALLAKHFMLWRDLAHAENLDRAGRRLAALIDSCCAMEAAPDADHGVYEMVEYQERQAKFVVGGQRVYEFMGYAWRLPLWDREFVSFWENVPLNAKVGQNLFREVLAEENWGGVWRPLLPSRTVRPRWAAALRAPTALVVRPFGRAAWREIDRRVFSWLTDPLCVMSLVPYTCAVFDRRGFRHGVSFRAEQYLFAHGLDAAGRPQRLPAP